jgi:hypothetical protein
MILSKEREGKMEVLSSATFIWHPKRIFKKRFEIFALK